VQISALDEVVDWVSFFSGSVLLYTKGDCLFYCYKYCRSFTWFNKVYCLLYLFYCYINVIFNKCRMFK